MDRMRRLVKEGVPEAFVGKSFFGMPKLLRYIARTGLDACDIDQVNAHFLAQSERHPAAEVLTQYIEERAATLELVAKCIAPQESWPPDWTAKGVAKELFLQIGYGGLVSTWCEKYEVEPEALPPIVHAFEREQQELRRIDAERHPELVRKAKELGKSRPEVTLQSLLNMQAERENSI